MKIYNIHQNLNALFRHTIDAILSKRAISGSKKTGPKRKSRIVGGKEAKPGQFPWQVLIMSDNQVICSVSLSSSEAICQLFSKENMT